VLRLVKVEELGKIVGFPLWASITSRF